MAAERSGVRPIRVCLFGTYDRVAHPRIAILEAALRAVGAEVVEAHVPGWPGGTNEKLRAASRPLRPRTIGRQAVTWARLLRRYRSLGPHDIVLVGYFGHLDVHLARLLAGRRRVVLDMFLSVYDTVVLDRGTVPRGALRAHLTRRIDRWAVSASRLALLDTQPQVDFGVQVLGLPPAKLAAVPVGAEPERFPATPLPPAGPLRVLFYGSFIPLHGTPTLAATIRLLADEQIQFTVVGHGQERAAFDRAVAGLANVTVIDWVDYDRLGELVSDHHVVLGVFGDGDKAARVVPNKVYQAACAGRPIVTADTPAVRAAFAPDEVVLVPPADPEALTAALRELAADRERLVELGRRARARFQRDYDLVPLGRHLLTLLEPLTAERDTAWVPAPRFLLRLDLVCRLLPRLDRNRPLLELGFGAGGMLAELADQGFRKVIGADFSASAVRDASQQLARFPVAQRPRLLRASLQVFDPARIRFGSILAFEVLEHVEDDQGLLLQAFDLLEPGGRMLVSVPAHQSRFSAFDELVGHYRRYERDELVNLFDKAGFEVETVWSYGYPLADVLDRIRAWTAKPSEADAPEARSAESCNRIPARGLVKLLVRPLTMKPFLLLQRRFVDTDRGDGYILLARRPAGTPSRRGRVPRRTPTADVPDAP